MTLGVNPCGSDPPRATLSEPCSDLNGLRADWADEANFEVEGRDLTPRQRVADEFVRCDMLRGRTYRQIVKVLGRPDEVGANRRTASYWLGDERGTVQVDSEYLDLTFGEAERVTAVEITGS